MPGSVGRSDERRKPDVEDEATRVDSGSRVTDVEEFVSESYLASSKDIAEADESMKKLGVTGMKRVTTYIYYLLHWESFIKQPFIRQNHL